MKRVFTNHSGFGTCQCNWNMPIPNRTFKPHRYVAAKPHARKLQKHIRILDGILIVTKESKEFYKETLNKILINLDEKRPPILPGKSKSACKQVELLGYIINSEGRTILIRKKVTYKNGVLRIQNDTSRDTYQNQPKQQQHQHSIKNRRTQIVRLENRTYNSISASGIISIWNKRKQNITTTT